MPNVFQALAEHVGISPDMLELQTGYNLLLGQVATGVADNTSSTVYLGMIPLDHWRVVGVGFIITANGASTVAETFEWGNALSDMGVADANAFGAYNIDTTADKQLADGDMYIASSSQGFDLVDVDALANAGAHTWGAGVSLGVWQTKAGLISFKKTGGIGATSTAIPFVLVEV